MPPILATKEGTDPTTISSPQEGWAVDRLDRDSETNQTKGPKYSKLAGNLPPPPFPNQIPGSQFTLLSPTTPHPTTQGQEGEKQGHTVTATRCCRRTSVPPSGRVSNSFRAAEKDVRSRPRILRLFRSSLANRTKKWGPVGGLFHESRANLPRAQMSRVKKGQKGKSGQLALGLTKLKG